MYEYRYTEREGNHRTHSVSDRVVMLPPEAIQAGQLRYLQHMRVGLGQGSTQARVLTLPNEHEH